MPGNRLRSYNTEVLSLGRALLVAATLNAVSCGSVGWCRAPEIQEEKDSSTGQTEYYTAPRRPPLVGGSFFSERYVFFNFHTFMPQTSTSVPYLLEVVTNTPQWVEIGAGTSLTLTIDQTQQLSLVGNGSCGKRVRSRAGAGNLLQELAFYPLSQEQLLHIGQAKTVAFRLVGGSQTITGTWNRELISDAASLAAKGGVLFATTTSQRFTHGEEYSAHLPGLGLDQVQRLMEIGQFDCATRLLDDVLAVNESGRGYYLRGEIARRRSPAPESQLDAIAAYERAAQAADAPVEAYRQIGLLQRARGDHRSAVAALKRYLELAPNAADTPLVREYLQEHEGNSP